MSKVIKSVSIVIKCDGRDLIDKMSKVVKGVSIVIKRVYNEISLKMGSNENWQEGIVLYTLFSHKSG
jgi:hypothetical protein